MLARRTRIFFFTRGYCFKKDVEYRVITTSEASKIFFAPFVLKDLKLSNENMVHPPYLRWSGKLAYFLSPKFFEFQKSKEEMLP